MRSAEPGRSRESGDPTSRRGRAGGARKLSGDGARPGALASHAEARVDEAERVMTVCNACRYCEGLCAVFPAMERLAAFRPADLRYLANLCHDCRACFHACPYAPPHDFDVNVPRVFAGLRRDTYARHAYPAVLASAYRRNGLVVSVVAAAAAFLVPLLAVLAGDPSVLTRAHAGPGAFYAIVPMALMVGPASAVVLGAFVVLCVSARQFWREIAGGAVSLRVLLAATRDALTLTYLGGDGEGCTYPTERHSDARRVLHHMVFWGFLLDFAATCVAAFYEHGLGRVAPYPLASPPVVLGTVGGLLLVAGTAGLLGLKPGRDRLPTDAGSTGMDVAFLVLLLTASSTGLALLALRDTAWMPGLLLLHLGAVAGFFVTLPFGKSVHALYRWLALVRSAREERAD